jgi:transcriptional regulator with XRE-family HTH domain
LDLGFDQKTIGQRIGVCCLTITGWEKGRTKPKVRHLPAIITFLGYDPRTEPKSLPEWLARFREGKGWSQKRMAEFLGVDEATISGWERGEHTPTRKSVEKIETALAEVAKAAAGDHRFSGIQPDPSSEGFRGSSQVDSNG